MGEIENSVAVEEVEIGRLWTPGSASFSLYKRGLSGEWTPLGWFNYKTAAEAEKVFKEYAAKYHNIRGKKLSDW